MMAASLPNIENSNPIRKLELLKDLDRVADLIEICFPIHLDQDGRTYVREMRKAARDMRLMGWLSNLAEMGIGKASGFVWEEGNQIIGNLSLIPFQMDGHRMHLIANVAVHPNYRRRGIARALTARTLAYLRQQNERQVWLQVRDDNPAAVNLYRSIGFADQVARTTWRIRPFEFRTAITSNPSDHMIRRRRISDWESQQRWLENAYPFTIRWNLPVDFRHFAPGTLQGVTNFLDGVSLRHWAFDVTGECQGAITWQKTTSFANNLWLAFPEETEDETLPTALDFIRKRLSSKHPLSIDYPTGRFQTHFEALGFENFHTLIWMRLMLN